MKATPFLFRALTSVLVVVCTTGFAEAELGTGFTYQGELKKAGTPLDDTADFEFTLWDDPTSTDPSHQVGAMVSENNQTVVGGLFTVVLDFGADIFTGEARWLEIKVRSPAGSGTFTTLTPRQKMTPAPHALALPGLWTQQNVSSPNLVGGFNGNEVIDGAVGAAIGGGGRIGETNRVTGSYGAVGGGVNNQAGDDDGDPNTSDIATVSGGEGNVASGRLSTIGGGRWNEALFTGATISGGGENIANGWWATVGGGRGNQAVADYSTIAGGGRTNYLDPNTANQVLDHHGTVGGGGDNQAGTDDGDPNDAAFATVGGGQLNAANGRFATIAGGLSNRAMDDRATIAGGYFNIAEYYGSIGGGAGNNAGTRATVAGGSSNNANGSSSFVGGGYFNWALGEYAMIPGGRDNEAWGNYSFAAGNQAKANHEGAFVWADANPSDFSSTDVNQFIVRASGGFGIGTDSPSSPLTVNGMVESLTDGFKFPDGTVQTTASTGGGSCLWQPCELGIYYDAGNVGIGTSTPGARLDVAGTAKMTGFQLTTSPTAGYVLTCDDASGTASWQPAGGGGGLTLPYSGSVATAGTAFAVSNTGTGNALYAQSAGDSVSGVRGMSTGSQGTGIYGQASGYGARAVYGIADSTGDTTNYGGLFVSMGQTGHGVHAEALGTSATGVYAVSQYGKAVDALTTSASTDEWTPAVYGRNEGAGDGVYGWSQSRYGAVGVTSSSNPDHAAVWAKNNGAGPGVLAEAGSDGCAAVFKGNVEIRSAATGAATVELGEGLDYAEGFDVTEKDRVRPGDVVVIDPDNAGKLALSTRPYDHKVAGIVAGANGLGSAVRLGVGRFDHDVALAGRVYCNVDASYGAVSPGDLLTTSPTPGHAMLVKDRNQAQGAILGKAMEALPQGQKGQVLVLVTLQ